MPSYTTLPGRMAKTKLLRRDLSAAIAARAGCAVDCASPRLALSKTQKRLLHLPARSTDEPELSPDFGTPPPQQWRVTAVPFECAADRKRAILRVLHCGTNNRLEAHRV